MKLAPLRAPRATLLAFAPSDGDVTEIDGAVLSNVFRTVTDTELVAVLPALSIARAVKLCVPSDIPNVSQLNVNGAATKDVTGEPSIDTATEVTPVLSEALTATETDPETVAPFTGERNETAGGVRSTC